MPAAGLVAFHVLDILAESVSPPECGPADPLACFSYGRDQTRRDPRAVGVIPQSQPRPLFMDKESFSLFMAIIGTLCWVVCFWWMHRISYKQNAVMDQLRAQGKRIEKLSKLEHDLIKEVHPQVAEIKVGMDAMVIAVKENTEINSPAADPK
ncbi:MAG: hypothetical protein ABI600_15140 [Luteolibacter sp.]